MEEIKGGTGGEAQPKGNAQNEGGGNGAQDVETVPLFKKKQVVIPLLGLFAVLTAGTIYWYIHFFRFISTDDAFVDGDRVSISSKMLGHIMSLGVKEGDVVKADQVLVRMDDSELQAQEALSRASVVFAEQSANFAKINLEKAKDEFDHAKSKYQIGVAPKEQFDKAQKSLEAARSQYEMALAQVGISKAQLQVTQTKLKDTVISAPMSGIVAKRWALPGDVVQAGQAIMSIYDIDNLWVTANFEETKIASIRVGSPVDLSVDAYPGSAFKGKVLTIGSYTAGQFSLIPPNNASGNFTKVTQRVPVKISIEDGAAGRAKGRLVPGLSVTVKIKAEAG
jgi:membrane fusion protein (multidrug efflux system)